MTSKQWRSTQISCWIIAAITSGLIAWWGWSDADPGRIPAQTTAVIMIASVVMSQIADAMRDRAFQAEMHEAWQQRWAERDNNAE